MLRPQRLLALIATVSLSASVLAADPPAFNSLWAELRSSARVTCPKDAVLPRPLVAAAACGDLARVRDRVLAGADLTTTDPRPALAGRTALHHAAQRGDAEILSLLLNAGADPNATDGQGNTPLHLLASSPLSQTTTEMARRLIAYGADAGLKNKLGRTPAAELETAAARRISPLHMDRKGLLELLLQADATGPMRTAEPSLVLARPAADSMPGDAAEASEAPAATAAEASEAPPEQSGAAAAEGEAAATTAGAGEAASSQPAAQAATEPEAKAEAQPEPKPAPKAVATPEPKPEPKPAPKAETKPEPEPAPKAEAKPEPKPEAKPEAEPETKAAAKAEPPKPAQPDPKEVSQALQSWAADWSSGDAEAYLRHYSKHFVPSDGNTLEAWREQRRQRVGKPASIQVKLSDVAIEIDGKRAVARFVQDYQSSDFKVVNRKVIEFAHEGRSWKIVSERTEG